MATAEFMKTFLAFSTFESRVFPSTITFMIFPDFLIFYKILLLPQVK